MPNAFWSGESAACSRDHVATFTVGNANGFDWTDGNDCTHFDYSTYSIKSD